MTELEALFFMADWYEANREDFEMLEDVKQSLNYVNLDIANLAHSERREATVELINVINKWARKTKKRGFFSAKINLGDDNFFELVEEAKTNPLYSKEVNNLIMRRQNAEQYATEIIKKDPDNQSIFDELEELNSILEKEKQDPKYTEANRILPPDLSYEEISDVCHILKKGRAKTLTEAINILVSDQRYQESEEQRRYEAREQQQSLNRILEQQQRDSDYQKLKDTAVVNAAYKIQRNKNATQRRRK